VLVAHPKVPAANLQDLIAFARANPAKLNYASAGAGSVPHVTMEWLKILGEAPILHVPYKGLAPATNDLLSGQVDMMFDNLGNWLHKIESGSVKALAVASEKRLPSLPQVPAISELFPGFVSNTWFAVVAPPKTPRAVAAQLSAAIGDVLRMPDVAKRLQVLSALPLGTSPAETEALLKEETERWRKVILTAGIKPD
jgi:tripartite-type tricarboxylate transporter receptor subunit TctC